MTAIKANDNDELEAELAKIVLERVETQRREAGEHVIRQVAFRYSMQPLIGAIERLQGLGLRDLRQQLIRLQYLKPVEGVRIEFGRFVATIVAHRDGSTCRVEMMRNEGTMIDVESFDGVTEAELSEHFRQIMRAIAEESDRPNA
jgi:hypothetical protein